MDLNKIMEQLQMILVDFAPKVIGAILVLILGLWIIKNLVKGTSKMMGKKDMDASLIKFLTSLMGAILKVALIVAVLGIVGIQATSFVAILGAAGLAIGMALSGTLSNFAGGVMLLIFKPFEVGHVITAQGFTGCVKEVGIFNTILMTPDNRKIIIPNAPLSSGAMVNISAESERRVDFVFGIGYNDDIDQAKKVIAEILSNDKRVLNSSGRETFIAVSELADSSVNFVVRTWVEAGDYWGVHFDTIEAVKKQFDINKISIPYPQIDMHLNKLN